MSKNTDNLKCLACKAEKITYEKYNPIYIHYDDDTEEKIGDVIYCDLHGIVEGIGKE